MSYTLNSADGMYSWCEADTGDLCVDHPAHERLVRLPKSVLDQIAIKHVLTLAQEGELAAALEAMGANEWDDGETVGLFAPLVAAEYKPEPETT